MEVVVASPTGIVSISTPSFLESVCGFWFPSQISGVHMSVHNYCLCQRLLFWRIICICLQVDGLLSQFYSLQLPNFVFVLLFLFIFQRLLATLIFSARIIPVLRTFLVGNFFVRYKRLFATPYSLLKLS